MKSLPPILPESEKSNDRTWLSVRYPLRHVPRFHTKSLGGVQIFFKPRKIRKSRTIKFGFPDFLGFLIVMDF